MFKNRQEIILKTGENVVIRSLEPQDIESYATFSEKIASETTHTLYSGALICHNTIISKWQTAMQSSYHLELGGFIGKKLISHISLYKPRPHHPFEKHVLEFGIAILKEYCHIGLGSKKLLMLECIAKNWQVKRIQAKVRTSNHQAITFYQKHGYQIEGVRYKAAYVNGRFENEFFIAKLIE